MPKKLAEITSFREFNRMFYHVILHQKDLMKMQSFEGMKYENSANSVDSKNI
jgi:hypothetical protein